MERICKYADQVLAEDDRVGSMKTALAVRDVAIAMLAVNDAFPNQRPLEFTGALDRRLPGGNKCIMDKARRSCMRHLLPHHPMTA